MSERYLCTSNIAEVHCPTCIHLEVEMHCLGRTFTENIPGVTADRALRREGLLENLDCLGVGVFFLSQ